MTKNKFKTLCNNHGIELKDLPVFFNFKNLTDVEIKKFIKILSKAKHEKQNNSSNRK